MPSTPTNPRPTNVRWLIVFLLVGFTFLGHFNRVSISVAGNEVFIRSGELSDKEMGFVYSAFLLVYTIGMLPGGYLIDRFGPRRMLTLLGLGFGLCSAFTGMLGYVGLSITGIFVPLLLIRGLAGAASVPLHPGAARTVSLWIPLRQRSFANGLVTSGALVGIAVTYPLFGLLLDHLHWQGAFVVSGATLIFFALVWLTLSADSADQHSFANRAERDLIGAGEQTPRRTRATFREVMTLFRNRSLVLLTLSYGALSYVQYLYFYWIEYYFENELKLPKSESRQAAFVTTMAMAVGMACGGWIADRLCRWLGHVLGCRVVAFCGFGLCAVFGLLAINRNIPDEVVLCFSLSFAALGLCEGIFWTTAASLANRNAGLACSLLNTGGNGVGMLAPALTPIIKHEFGWSAAIVVGCVICAVGGALWIGIRPATLTEPKT